MSKNFELLQHAEMNLSGPPRAEPSTYLAPANRDGNGEKNATVQDAARFNGDESLRLVQRIFLQPGKTLQRVVLFCGIDPGNGCSRTCAQAAETLASNVPGPVCLVDANLRAPALSDFFGIGNHWGLTDALSQDGPIKGFAKQVRKDNLWLLSGGSLAGELSGTLNAERLRARMTELRSAFDYVLIDVAPIGQRQDAITVGQLTDGIVLVLEAHSTRRDVALKVMEELRAGQVQILGAVLNKRTFPIPEPLYRRL